VDFKPNRFTPDENLKKSLIVLTIIGGIFGIIGFVFAVERPVMYYREFLPMVAEVIELVAENTHAQWVRADEQVKRREARIKRNGDKASPKERAELRRWKATLYQLERKLEKLKPSK